MVQTFENFDTFQTEIQFWVIPNFSWFKVEGEKLNFFPIFTCNETIQGERLILTKPSFC